MLVHIDHRKSVAISVANLNIAWGELEVAVPPVQQQSGCTDSGLFAIVFTNE